ncbi:MAG TPA: YbaB/EbfC family nucleoid-associated protein [Micromonosporaceae bacterium]
MGTETGTSLDALMAECRAMTGRLDRLRTEVATLTATARSADRCVRVTVGAHGQLTDLAFDPVVAARLDLHTLANRVLEAAERAAGEVRERSRAALVDALPERLRQLVTADATIDMDRLIPADVAGFARAGR